MFKTYRIETGLGVLGGAETASVGRIADSFASFHPVAAGGAAVGPLAPRRPITGARVAQPPATVRSVDTAAYKYNGFQ